MEKIPLEKITVLEHNALERYKGMKMDDSTELLLNAIMSTKGLIHPIPVSKISHEIYDYEVKVGVRRFWAYERLNKKHPGEGWDKIPAIIVGLN